MPELHLQVWVVDTYRERIGIITVWHQVGETRLLHGHTILYLLRITTPIVVEDAWLEKKLASRRHCVHCHSLIMIAFVLPFQRQE